MDRDRSQGRADTNEYDPACIAFNSPVECNKYDADNFSSVQHGVLFFRYDKEIRTIDAGESTAIVLRTKQLRLISGPIAFLFFVLILVR